MDGLTITTQGNNGISKSDSISNVRRIGPENSSSSATSGSSFADTLKDAIQSVDQLQKSADVQVQKLATGESQNLHETMIAVEKADVALRLMMQVRNKVIDAYQEIMKMQV